MPKKSVLHEPLLHFFAIGALFFLVYSLVGGDRSPEGEEGDAANSITVGQRQLDHLTATWEQLWSRKPTALELTQLVNDYIREEALYREALELGLDEDDTIVRRRLAQKMAFLSRDLIADSPTDEELGAWFRSNQEAYRVPELISFQHLYFSSEERGEQAAEDAKEALARLRANDGEPTRETGDRFMGRNRFSDIGEQDVKYHFGEEFASQAFTLSSTGWHGPIRSSFGWHLVNLLNKVDTRIPQLEEIRFRVEADWFELQAQSANGELVRRLIRKYGLEYDSGILENLTEEELVRAEQ